MYNLLKAQKILDEENTKKIIFLVVNYDSFCKVWIIIMRNINISCEMPALCPLGATTSALVM